MADITTDLAEAKVELQSLLDLALDKAYEMVRDNRSIPLPRRECIRLGIMVSKEDRQRELVDPAYKEAANQLWDLIQKLPEFELITRWEATIRQQHPTDVRIAIEAPPPNFTEDDLAFMKRVFEDRGRR